MELLLKLTGVGLVGALLALLTKRGAPEIGLMLGMATVCALLFFALDLFGVVKNFMETLTSLTGLSETYITPVLKTTGIAVITKLTAESCRDAGERAIAAAVELAGGLLALTVALPLFQRLMELMKTLI